LHKWATHLGIGLLGILFCAGSVSAEQERTNSRRTWGLAFCAGSAVLLKKGWDFHRQADEFYDIYRRATDERDAEQFFDRADNRDVKSQMSFLVAGAFAVAGWQFLSRGEGERETGSKILGLEVATQIEADRGGVILALQRRFF